MVEPLTQEEIRVLELNDRQKEQALSRGAWTAHMMVEPSLRFFVPPLPTQQDRLVDVGEDWALSDLGRGHVPGVSVLRWIDEYVAGHTTEGQRESADEFWHTNVQVAV